RFDPDAKPGVSNLLTIFSALTGSSIVDLETSYSGRGYGDFKSDLADAVLDFVTPVRERFRGYLDDPAELDAVLTKGAERAREVAVATMESVRDRVGFLPEGG